jgi:CHAT domain-containing protein
VLALLPLHAAGHHGKDGGGRTVLDRVVSSYVPTLRTPTTARLSPDAGGGGLLVVSVPDAEGHPRLPGVEQEVKVMRERMGADGRVTVLTDGAATRERVCEELPRHKWVHFVCHGYQNLINPSDGGLILEDGALTVADMSRSAGAGEFAFLSACETSSVGIAMPDEAVTAAAALHYAGYNNVIGTLWSVYDGTTAEIAEHVYGSLTGKEPFSSDLVARALHEAVRAQRTRDPRRPDIWASFLHIGS